MAARCTQQRNARVGCLAVGAHARFDSVRELGTFICKDYINISTNQKPRRISLFFLFKHKSISVLIILLISLIIVTWCHLVWRSCDATIHTRVSAVSDYRSSLPPHRCPTFADWRNRPAAAQKREEDEARTSPRAGGLTRIMPRARRSAACRHLHRRFCREHISRRRLRRARESVVVFVCVRLAKESPRRGH